MRQVYQLMPGVEGSMDMYYSGNDQDYRCVGHITRKNLKQRAIWSTLNSIGIFQQKTVLS